MSSNGNKFKNIKRSVKFGAASTALTVVFIGATVLINVLTSALVDRFPLKADLTREKYYDIGSETLEMLRNLSEEVTITILTPVETFDSMASQIYYSSNKGVSANPSEIIKKYAQYSPYLSFNVVDATLNPGHAAKYSVGGAEIGSSTIIIESEKRFKTVDLYDLFQFNVSGDGVLGLRAEQKLTSAVMYVVGEDIPGIYATTGHDEFTAQVLDSIATENNYSAGTVNLLTSDIPEDAKVIVVNSPQRDFAAEEIEKLDAFINRGNTAIMVFYEAGDSSLPRFESYIEEWGIAKNNNFVIDLENAYAYPYNVVMEKTGHEISKNIGGGLVMPSACELTVLFEAKNSFVTEVLASTYSTAYAKSLENGATIDNFEKTETDSAGPFPSAVLSTKLVDGKNTVVNSYVAVFASSQMTADGILTSSTFGNSELLASVLGFVRGNKDMVNISPIYFDDATLDISVVEANIIAVIFCIVLPLALIACGLVVFFRRRNL